MLKSGVPAGDGPADHIGRPEKPAHARHGRQDPSRGRIRQFSLHEALGKYPVQFDELYVNLVKAGESAGVLDTILDDIASYKERIESIKGKIKKALYYPAAVIAVAIIVSSILLIYVIPQFEGIFHSFGTDLPAFTRSVINVSDFLREQGGWVILGLIATVVGLDHGQEKLTQIRSFHRPGLFEATDCRQNPGAGSHRALLPHTGDHVRRWRAAGGRLEDRLGFDR